MRYIPLHTVIRALFVLACLGCMAADAAAGRAAGRPVLGISVFGHDRVSRDAVLDAAGIEIGAPWSRALADSARARIKRLAGVEFVTVRRLRTGVREEGVRLVIEITEGGTVSFRPVLRRNATNRVGFGVGVVERNFRGRNERLGAWFALRGGTVVAASWRTAPVGDLPRFEWGIDARWSGYDYPFPDAGDLLLDERVDRVEAALSCRLRLPAGFSVIVAPGIDLIEVAEPMVTGDWQAGAPDQPAGLFTAIETAVELDRRQRRFYPRSGFLLSVSRRDWGVLQSGAEMKNHRWEGRGALFVPLGRTIAAVEVEGASVHGRVPLLLRRHIGGEYTIRGREFGDFVGEYSIVQRSELRIPLNFDELDDIGNPIILVDCHLFWDAGVVWTPPEELERDRVHSGFGIGLRLIPRIGVEAAVGCGWHLEGNGNFYLELSTGS